MGEEKKTLQETGGRKKNNTKLSFVEMEKEQKATVFYSFWIK